MRKTVYLSKFIVLGLVLFFAGVKTSEAQLLKTWYYAFQSAQPVDTFGVHNGVAFSINNKAYIVTGDTGKPALNELKFTNQLWEYDPFAGTWTRKADFPGKPRIGAVGFSIGSFGYVGLGFDTSRILDSIFSISPEVQIPIFDSLGNQIGFSIDPADTIYRNTPIKVWTPSAMKDLWRYDPATNTWTQRANYPENFGLAMANVAVNQGKAYVGGGYDTTDTYYKLFYEYDPATNAWTKKTDFPGTARAGAASFAGIQTQDSFGFISPVRNFLYMGLGQAKTPNTYFKDFYRYNPATDAWVRVADLPNPGFTRATSYGFGRSGHVMTGFNGNYLRSHYEFDINSNSWLILDNFRDSSRAFAHGYQVGPYLFINGGYGIQSRVYSNHLFWGADTTTVRILNTLPDTICGGDSLQLVWQATDTIYSGNKYYIEISDSSGAFFGDFKRIDSISNTTTLVTKKVKIPESIIEGANYKFRIVSSNKAKFGQPTVKPVFVKQAVTIIVPPARDTICAGGTKMFTAIVQGTNFSSGTGLKYQWFFEGAPISDFTSSPFRRRIGTNSDTLIIDSVTMADAGAYALRITGDCDEKTTSSGTLVVLNVPAPTIISSPKDSLVCETDSISFPINATGFEVNYAWFRNGKPITPNQYTFGDSSNNLIISNFLKSDSGWYKARVFEECGAFRFTDSFRVTFGEVVRVQDQLPRDTSVVENSDVQYKVFATGVNLKYQWYRGNTPLTNGADYSGVDDTVLTVIDARTSDVGFYRCLVTGDCGPGIFSPISLLDVEIRPNIIKQPADSFRSCEGGEAILSIIAEGANLSYQWFKNGVPVVNGGNITGAQSRELIFNPSSAADAGTYFCRVYNGTIDSTQSDNGILNILPTPPKPSITKIAFNILRCDQSGADYYIWDANGSALVDKTQTITISQPGDYRVRTVFAGCISEHSNPFTYVLSSFGPDVKDLKVYPNPTSRMVTIEMPESIKLGSSVNIVMIDLLGKEVYNFSGESNYNHEINVQNLSKGVYLVRVVSGNQTYVTKLVKE